MLTFQSLFCTLCNSQYFAQILCVFSIPAVQGGLVIIIIYHHDKTLDLKTTHIHRIMCMLVSVLRVGSGIFSRMCVCGVLIFRGSSQVGPCWFSCWQCGALGGFEARLWPKGLQGEITAWNTISSTHHQNTQRHTTLEGQNSVRILRHKSCTNLLKKKISTTVCHFILTQTLVLKKW